MLTAASVCERFAECFEGSLIPIISNNRFVTLLPIKMVEEKETHLVSTRLHKSLLKID